MSDGDRIRCCRSLSLFLGGSFRFLILPAKIVLKRLKKVRRDLRPRFPHSAGQRSPFRTSLAGSPWNHPNRSITDRTDYLLALRSNTAREFRADLVSRPTEFQGGWPTRPEPLPAGSPRSTLETLPASSPGANVCRRDQIKRF